MKYILKNKLTFIIFILIGLVDIATGDFLSLSDIPLCIIVIYYNYKRNVAANVSFQQLFVKNSEQKLQLLKAGEELKTFFQITPNILGIASEGNFKRVSDEFLKILGYTIEEITSRPCVSFIHPDDYQRTIDLMGDAKGDNNVFTNFVNRYITKDGRFISIKWQGILLNDMFYVSGNDITDEILLAEQLKTSEHKFRGLFEKSPTPLCIFDKELFLFSSVNFAFSSQLGYSVDEMIGRDLSEFIHKEDVKDSFDVVQSGENTEGYKNRYVCKNGDIKTLVWSTLGDDERFVYCTAEFLN